ncbi:protein Skeletor, isoforms B/C isoform X1 [Epargyreus clarus]|uniref:protein Skeletor, isoforms B/C isoform X1 n=1 Tax=Epargyreus clarus TaxID=520877 RepID=UPI003C2D0CF1
MFPICFVLLVLIARDCNSQDDEGPYRGKFIGKLNSYHHQVSGDVYAVDDWTLLLVDFNYDGTGDDTFFWAGDSGRPGPMGYIVPDQHGKTNILERYYNEELRLRLPDGRKVSQIAWLAVYDIASQNAFGDVYVPEEFEAPAPRALAPLAPAPGARVSSGRVRFLDASTFIIPEFRYDGSGEEVYFWTGVGPQPSSRGMKIPDEDGYLEPIRAYNGEDVQLVLPGGKTVFDADWIALWDAGSRAALASVLVPDALNVPPGVMKIHNHKTSLPHCKQLHRDYQVSWEVFGNQVTIQLAGQVGENEYMAFGISGSDTSSAMLGADVAVAAWDARLKRGLATDYNITAKTPCVSVLGQWRGVCRDERLGAQDSNQVFSAARDDGLTVLSYRRQLAPSEPIDREWPTEKPVFVVWAVGALDHELEPAFHRLYHKHDVRLQLAQNPPENDCFPFTIGGRAPAPAAWERAALTDPALRVFRAALGPAGGARGLAGRARAAPARAWYVNGQLAPDLQLRRGLHYTVKVRQRPARARPAAAPRPALHGQGTSTASSRPTCSCAAACTTRSRYVNGQLAPDLQLRRGLHYTVKVRQRPARARPAAAPRPALHGQGTSTASSRPTCSCAAACTTRSRYVNGQLAPDLQLRRGLHYTVKVRQRPARARPAAAPRPALHGQGTSTASSRPTCSCAAACTTRSR